jgi:hypothetical protein
VVVFVFHVSLVVWRVKFTPIVRYTTNNVNNQESKKHTTYYLLEVYWFSLLFSKDFYIFVCNLFYVFGLGFVRYVDTSLPFFLLSSCLGYSAMVAVTGGDKSL